MINLKINFQMRLLLLIFFILPADLFAQASYDSSFHFYYYDQKLSMFEIMPDQAGETVWMGDSITDGGEWSELFPLQKTLNRGISSDNTFGILFRLAEVTKRKPKKIFLLIGINDIARNIPDSVILRNYQKIITGIQQQTPRSRLYIQSILPTNDNFSDFKNHQHKTAQIMAVNSALQKMCNGKKIVYVDLYNQFTDVAGKLDTRYTNDGLHLTGEGYKKWKQVLLEKKLM